MKKRFLAISVVAFGLAHSQSPETLPGDPLPGITGFEFERFRLGLEDFTEVETPQDGLGPAFNGTSCAVCHSVPSIGGISSITEVRAGKRTAEGAFEVLHGGTLFHLFSVPPHTCQVQIPAEANVIARRMPIPLFGAGLVEAIADVDIIAAEDPDDLNGDGISGRAARIEDVATHRERIGRFGWKAQQATLLAFSGDAYRNEMGVTNDLFPEEFAAGVTAEQMRLCSITKGLEDIRNRRTRQRGIDNFEAFMKFLAPPARATVNDDASTGEVIFQSIGCAACHTPAFTTEVSANPLFDRKRVPLYSDLLLHDVGTGDGLVQAAAEANEIRTPALWGIRFRRPFLHDGSASTMEEAIRKHAGEASAVIENFNTLDPAARTQLLAFLGSI